MPSVAAGLRHVYHQYTIRVAENRDAVSAELAELGVGNAVYYPTPVHRLRPFLLDGAPDPRWDLPETERAAAEALSLPVHPQLSESDLVRIVDGVTKAVDATAGSLR